MAIKIIKEGKPVRFVVECPECGCEFQYEKSDLTIDYGFALTCIPVKYRTFVCCPCCGERVYHGTTEGKVDLPVYGR